MLFADVKAKTTITDFTTADEMTILGAMETAYNGSAIAKMMFDDWIAIPGQTIDIKFSLGKFEAFAGLGKLFLDLSYLTDNTYISPTGQAVEDTPVTAIVHELGHALTGRDDDNDNVTDYKGANVNFVNTIYKELGLPEQVSYIAYDSKGTIHQLNFQYTNGMEIDRAKSGDKNWDSSPAGNSKDLLIGGPSANLLLSGAGNDFLYGAGGADSLNGGIGNDFLDGEDGNADLLFGGEGNDTLNDVSGVAGAHGGLDNDYIDVIFAAGWVNPNNTPRSDGKITGGYGNDTIYARMTNSNFFLNMKGDEPSNSSDSNLKDGKDTIYLSGTYANSVVDLGGGDDLFYGGSGNDNVTGKDGDDTIQGFEGNDRLKGMGGIDQLIGGKGNDTYVLNFYDDSSEIQENPDEGTDTVEVPYDFSLTGTNLENVTLTETSAISALGNTFNNVLKGNSSNNNLIGGMGNDTLIGNGGQDVLTGGAGNDNLTGGEGTDRFVFKFPNEGIDKINDFNTTYDEIAVSASRFGAGLSSGFYLTFEQFFIGSSADTDANRFIYNSKNGQLFFDADGKGDANSIQLATLSSKLTFLNIFVDV